MFVVHQITFQHKHNVKDYCEVEFVSLNSSTLIGAFHTCINVTVEEEMEKQHTWLEGLVASRAVAEVGGLLQCLGPDLCQREKQKVQTQVQVQGLVERSLGV